MGNIENVFITCVDDDEGILTAPPKQQLELLVIAGVLWLRGWPGERPNSFGEDPLWTVRVGAKSTALALEMLIRDDEMELPEAIRQAEEALRIVGERRSAGQGEART